MEVRREGKKIQERKGRDKGWRGETDTRTLDQRSCHKVLQSAFLGGGGSLYLNWITVLMNACQHQVPAEYHP